MPCNTCGLNDHADFFDNRCPDFVPINNRSRHSTVCVSALGRYKYPEYQWIIEKAAEDASLVASRVVLLLHAYYSKVIECKEEVEPVSEGLFRQAYSLVQDGRSPTVNVPSERLKEVYESCFEGVEKLRTKGIANINTYMIKTLLTTCSNYNTVDTLRCHVKHYLVAKYHLNKTHAGLVADKVVRFNAAGEFRDNDALNQIIAVEWRHLQSFLGEGASTSGKEDDRSPFFLRYRSFMLATIEKREVEEKTEYNKFRLLPVLSEGRKFITLDNRGLNLLATHAKPRGTTKEIKAEIDSKFESLDGFFELDRGVGKGEKWRRSPVLRTNGIELHIVFEKNTKRTKTGQLKRERANTQFRPQDRDPNYDYADCSGEVGDDDFIAIDPGNYSPYTWVQKNPQKGLEGEKPFLRETISKRWYERRSKRRARINRHKSDVRRFKLNEITAALAEHHLKHVAYDAVKQAVKLRLKHQRRLHEVFSKRQRLKLKFEARTAEQKTIDQIVKRMRGKKKMKLIVFGDASKMSGIRGTTMGAPNAKIKRHALSRGLNEGFAVKMEDEFRTSKMSSCCEKSEMRCIKTSHPRIGYTGPRKTFRVNGICRCQSCHRLFARDVNAAINIWKCARSRLHGTPRPAHLCRTSTVNLNT